MEAKVDGRVTVAGQWTRCCFSGKTAEVMYYQIPADKRVERRRDGDSW
jgi:hypothetical protein